MAKTRREFSPEFKREAVALLETSGRPLMRLKRELERMRMERDVLKKAIGIFAEVPR